MAANANTKIIKAAESRGEDCEDNGNARVARAVLIELGTLYEADNLPMRTFGEGRLR